MAQQLTVQEMEDILFAHEKGELENDIDATMATVSPDPHYEFPTLGVAVDGREAVLAMYRRLLSGSTTNIAAERRVHAVAENALLREAHATFNNSEGERVNGLYLAVLSFDPELKLICGERMYTDTNFKEYLAEALGDDFDTLPGVSKISDSFEPIAVHDAFRSAAERGVTITRPSLVDQP